MSNSDYTILHQELYAEPYDIILVRNGNLYGWGYKYPIIKSGLFMMGDLETCYRTILVEINGTWGELYRDTLKRMATFIVGMLGDDIATAIALELMT